MIPKINQTITLISTDDESLLFFHILYFQYVLYALKSHQSSLERWGHGHETSEGVWWYLALAHRQWILWVSWSDASGGGAYVCVRFHDIIDQIWSWVCWRPGQPTHGLFVISSCITEWLSRSFRANYPGDPAKGKVVAMSYLVCNNVGVRGTCQSKILNAWPQKSAWYSTVTRWSLWFTPQQF